VVEAGVQRVAIAVLDPTPKTHRKGVELLRKAGVEVQVGLCREKAVRGNAAFFKLAAVGKPLVIAKWAMTADGKIATRTGDSRWISGPESRRRVHEVRGIVDCIIVGGRTARQDDPLLTCRDAEKRRTAARLVLCGRGVPSHDSRLVQTADEAPVLLACPKENPPEGLDPLLKAGCTALPLPTLTDQPTRVDPGALLQELGRREMSNVLVEGGSEVLGSFLDAGEVDRVMVFVAPLLVGGSQAPSAVGGVGPAEMRSARQLSGVKVSRTGCDVLVEGRLTDPMNWAP
jgi:diaminohydroxyphosphoribosylaminopyrimidine deaminase/5-amino-6-(5-phosphoribosylamino)uracil reductase